MAIRLLDRFANAVNRVKTPTRLQYDNAECGAIALGIVLAYYGCHVPSEELRTACGVSRDGSNALNIVKAARRYGMNASGLRRSNLDGLKTLTAPVILYWNFNHFVVFEGTSRSTRNKSIYINDPATGPRTVSFAEFDKAFTGLVLVCTPGATFQKRGQAFDVVGALHDLIRGSEGALFVIGLISLFLLIPGFALPALLRFFIDNVLDGQHGLLNLLLIGMAGVFLARVILTWLQQWLFLRLEYKLTIKAASALFQHLLHLPLTFFAQRLGGDLVSRVQLTQRTAQLVSGEVATTAINVLLIGFYGLLMLQYDVWLTVLTLLFAIINLMALRYSARYRRDANTRLLQEQAKLNGMATNGLQAIESLKAAGMETAFFARWAGLQATVVNAEQDLTQIAFMTNAIPYLLTLLNAALILIIGGERVLMGQLTAGVVIAFQSLAFSFMQPIGQLIGFGTQLQEIEGSLSRIHDVLAQPMEGASGTDELGRSLNDPDEPNPVAGFRLAGSLSVRDLSFGYSPLDPPLIDGLNFNLAPGQQIALVGASGSGKSTIASLIGGLYAPWRGEILFDGQRRNVIPHRLLTESVAMVDQHIVLFTGTIRDNLTLWDTSVPFDDVIAATKDACIHDVIMARPDGYDSLIVESGANFSGGERQRLEIARALVRNPTLLILDEATSALDVDTEEQVIRNIQRRGVTCLMIAHRLSAIRHCNEIYLLDGGRIVWEGPYEHYLNFTEQTKLNDAASARTDFHTGEQFIDLEATRPGRLTDLTRKTARWMQDDALTDALHHIFAALHLSISDQALRARIVQVPQSNNVFYATAAAFRLRARRVKLTDGWSASAVDPLLGYRVADQVPIALIPKALGQYELIGQNEHNAVEETPIHATLSDRVMKTAYQFYRPLPDRVLRDGDLVDYAASTIKPEVAGAFGLVILLGLLSILVPIVTGTIFDRVLPASAAQELLVLGGVLISSALLATAVNLMAALLVTRLEGKIDSTLQAAVWDRLLRLPVSFFRRYSVGDLVERALGISQLRAILADVGAYLLVGSVLTVFNAGLMFAYSVPLALIVIGAILLYLAIGLWLGRLPIRYQRQSLDLNGVQRDFALQILSGISKLRAVRAEQRAFDLWLALFRRERKADYAARLRQNIVTTLVAGYPILVTALLFILVIHFLPLTLGQFLAFNAAFVQLLAASSQFGRAATRIQTALPVLDRLRPIVQTLPESKPTDQPIGNLQGAIRIEKLFFRYDVHSRYILDNLSLTIAPGDFVAITAPSGSGKSTLLRLLLGFEQAERGEIYYDGRPVSSVDIETVRSQIGVVLQNGLLVSGDIYTNIVGSRSLTMADAWRGARLAHIEPDIKQMPMGMNTIINEGKTSLSGGQIQRLLIARALAGKPKIVFFDEATSALDEQAQAVVMDNLRQLRVTCIVIAHRLSTITYADHVFNLVNGQLITLK